ncbi:hypothetical protein [Lutibacter sp.]
MSWEGGVDLVALSNEDGSPKVMDFVSTSKTVGDYFAKNVFADTPFEQAPTIVVDAMDFNITDDIAEVTIKMEGFIINLKLSNLDDLTRENRQSPALPFHDHSLEAKANKVALTINGVATPVIVPPMGMSGRPAAVYSAAGVYSR